MTKPATSGLSLLLGLVLALGCGPKKEEASAVSAKAAAAAPISISIDTVRLEKVEQRVEITGTLAPIEEATLSVEADGRIIQLGGDLGDEVKKNELLLRIDAREYGLRREQSAADLAASTADYNRVEGLVKENVVAQAQADESRRRLDLAKVALALTSKKLADTELRAPFSGRIAKRLVEKGEYVRMGTAAYELVRISPLKFRGDVPEQYSSTIKPGDAVTALTESRAGAPLLGKIIRISPSVTEATRSFGIEAEIENPDGAVKPGSFARLVILTGGAAQSLTVQESAVVLFAGTPRVYLVAGGKVTERVVILGGKVKDRYVVTSGLLAGNQVASTGVELLSDGRTVTAREGK